MTDTQFMKFWQVVSDHDLLPEDIEKFCEENEITVDYYIEEFI